MTLRHLPLVALLLAGVLAIAAHAEDGVLAAAAAAREAARAADAVRLAPARWAAAEREMRNAARRLEKGDQKGAAAGGERAAALYAAAELDAIKGEVLTAARARLVALEDSGAGRLAPRTAARARELLQQADALLNTDRSRREDATALAAAAAKEADHAQALAALIREQRGRKATEEDMLLEWEAALARIGEAAGMPDAAGREPRAGTEAAVDAVGALRRRAEAAEGELGDRSRQLNAQDEEIRELESRLTGASGEARRLTEELLERQHADERFRTLAALFTPADGSVLREGDHVILRLQGLGFANGTAKPGPGATALLQKVQQALNLFPAAPAVVEGHTDGSGDPAANQKLSQARAEAVRDVLAGPLGVAAARLSAVGYGDSRPVASNATAEGRRLNRRVDIVLSVPPGA